MTLASHTKSASPSGDGQEPRAGSVREPAGVAQDFLQRGEKSRTERESDLRRMRGFAHLLDSSIRLPGGYRIGLDGIIGVIPVIGDGVTALASSWIVIRAAQLGVSTPHLIRMMINILLESVVGVIPVVGDIFDFAWKANERNMVLAERHLPTSPPQGNARRRLTYAAITVVSSMLLIIVALVVLAVRLLLALFSAAGG